jgi:sigma-B regulation protein RsbU (phosphoserine phosphatase)
VREEPDWDAAILDLLERAELARPDGLADVARKAAARAGADLTLYLADLEQERLWPVDGERDSVPIDDSPGGQAFILVKARPGKGDAIWVPMVDGSERLGVAEVVPQDPPAEPSSFADGAGSFMGLLGHLVSTKMPYGDMLQQVRRTQPMSPAGELVFSMLPPLTFSCQYTMITAVLEPAYDMGGDAFDYAVNDSVARVAIFDAMGRGLGAGLTAAATLAATRAARRDGGDLVALARAADRALAENFPDLRFVTGLLAELDAGTGELRYLNAGHPLPILFRKGRAIRTLTDGRRTPLGVAADREWTPATETMEPGDQLLIFTDGVVDAADAHGDRFGVTRLTDLAEELMAEGLPGPEVLRRLTHTVIEFQGGTPSDDTTLLLIERTS